MGAGFKEGGKAVKSCATVIDVKGIPGNGYNCSL
jgi:hypothetical protein